MFSVKVCFEKTLKDSLVSFPSTIAHVEPTPVQGICMANSVQIVPGNLTAFCDSDGEWNTNCLESRCVCKEDMENTRGLCTGLEEKIRKSFSLKLGNKGNITLRA